VNRGEIYLSPRISKCVIDSYLERLENERPLREETPRQREIVQLVAEGKSTKEIAFFLKVSIKTVEAHRAQLMERLGIHDVADLVRYAMRVGLVPPEKGLTA
jgi:DNA-binding NarL/FixJ family response regulator